MDLKGGTNTVALDTVCHTDVARVGVKAAMLGTLLGAGLPVPRGLRVTTAVPRAAAALISRHQVIHRWP
jgi:phosphoenolpyruvate synthase/pyruvate phosphate dikinase